MTAAAALTVASALLAGGCARSPAARAPTADPARQSAGSTLLATLNGAVPRFASPGRIAAGWVPGTWYGARSVLPVVATRPGWVRVRLAQRPNGSTAWLPGRDVKLSSTPYRIVVNLATTRLTLYRAGRKAFVAAAGVGTKSDPTPTGQYFVAFLEDPPASTPGYGAFIMVTSAHSETISDWDGSGDAVIGIHGPLGSGQVIGTTGARISHGCIRLQEAALLRLREVPPGTPIDIVG
jgi:lipoprotein-anchoring transpeptidase ErfK/SrfK